MVIWMKKYEVYYLVILLLQIVAYYLSCVCGGYFIKEILMEVHPPLSDGGGSTSFTDLR